MNDADRIKAIALVAELHRFAEKCEGDDRALIESAAVLLDEVQAGIAVFMPGIESGYALVRLGPAVELAA